jgi:hypothetical protein
MLAGPDSFSTDFWFGKFSKRKLLAYPLAMASAMAEGLRAILIFLSVESCSVGEFARVAASRELQGTVPAQSML